MPLVDMAKPEMDNKWRDEVYPALFVTEEITTEMSRDEKLAVAKRLREPGKNQFCKKKT